MKIGIYENTKEVNEAILRFAVANNIYTHDIDIWVEDRDGAYVLNINEEN